MTSRTHKPAALAACFLLSTGASIAAEAPADATEQIGAIEVTATRVPESVDRVPASITVIDGAELRARGANDLRTALSLVPGADAPSGGDAGPASAVPSFWGLHEFDAFLLVVDGVPWGGAFNPSIPSLDLNNVERIEVLKGAAPVVYGATAFVGVVQVIHYPAGEAANEVNLSYGSFGTVQGSGSYALPTLGGWRQSIAASGEREQFSDSREAINNGKFGYRGAGDIAGGSLRFDANITAQRQAPNSPAIRQESELVTPVDANFEPADARIAEHRYNFVLGYRHDTPIGQWETTASYAHSNINDVRGFLRADFDAPQDDAPNNADYMNQDRGIIDAYLDTHFIKTLADGLELVYGADLLYGSGKQQSTNGAYFATPDGSLVPQSTAARPIDEINTLDDRRSFIGQYAQLDWKPDARWDLNGGLRVNETRERNTSTHTDTADATADTFDFEKKSKTKLSGALGASYLAWSKGLDEAVVYADYRNTFKPAAIDFGPDVPFPSILSPETARSYEGGVKGRVLGGRLSYEAELFFLHFNNLVVASTDAAGNPVMENAGSELFKGVELGLRYRFDANYSVKLNYSYHDARYGQYLSDDENGPQNFGGKHVELSPHALASYGFLYAPPQGFQATFAAAYIGSRYLDRGNEDGTPSYVTLDGSIGWRYRRYGIALHAYNLTDERKPTSESEFGDSSYYLLPSRSLLMTLQATL